MYGRSSSKTGKTVNFPYSLLLPNKATDSANCAHSAGKVPNCWNITWCVMLSPQSHNPQSYLENSGPITLDTVIGLAILPPGNPSPRSVGV